MVRRRFDRNHNAKGILTSYLRLHTADSARGVVSRYHLRTATQLQANKRTTMHRVGCVDECRHGRKRIWLRPRSGRSKTGTRALSWRRPSEATHAVAWNCKVS